jgi:hypothetical protein
MLQEMVETLARAVKDCEEHIHAEYERINELLSKESLTKESVEYILQEMTKDVFSPDAEAAISELLYVFGVEKEEDVKDSSMQHLISEYQKKLSKELEALTLNHVSLGSFKTPERPRVKPHFLKGPNNMTIKDKKIKQNKNIAWLQEGLVIL